MEDADAWDRSIRCFEIDYDVATQLCVCCTAHHVLQLL